MALPPTEPPVRKIIHVDMDAFYTSVEQRDRPELRGRPVIVGGSPEGRGVVASASYEARKFGVRSAMSAAKARRLCPQAVFVYPDFSRYKEASERIQEIFLEVTPAVEPLSLDEAFLDVTENLRGEKLAGRIAIHLKARIREKTGLTASAGVGPNKFIAKVASDLQKPDGLVIIPPGRVQEFVDRLPVEKLWGVGPVTAKRLHALGIREAKDIRNYSLLEMEHLVGSFGRFLHELAHGRDDRPVSAEWEPKSRGTETTFEKDVLSVTHLTDVLGAQALEVAEDLRRIGRLGRTVTLKLRYDDFTTVTRSRTLSFAFDDAPRIAATSIELLQAGTEAGRRPVRLIGISIKGLDEPRTPEQLRFDLPIW